MRPNGQSVREGRVVCSSSSTDLTDAKCAAVRGDGDPGNQGV